MLVGSMTPVSVCLADPISCWLSLLSVVARSKAGPITGARDDSIGTLRVNCLDLGSKEERRGRARVDTVGAESNCGRESAVYASFCSSSSEEDGYDTMTGMMEI